MAKTLEQKKQILSLLKDNVGKQTSMIFIEVSGIQTKKINQIKESLKNADAKMSVAKKTLLNLAMQDKYPQNSLKEIKKEMAVIFGFGDEVSPSKSVYESSKKEKNLKILGGYIRSAKDKFLLESDIISLAKLPTKQELIGQTVGTIAAPLTGFLSVLQGNLRGLVCVLSKIQSVKQ
ncbi:MAG: 50S ribosomal protein L10 [Candidatus Pacebacteria bacterium]|nr:50S ribosomal protein L10 [Candidatus Paceibacterota bacterium]